MPTKSYDTAAGGDLYVVAPDDQIGWFKVPKKRIMFRIDPGERVTFHTGLKIQLFSDTLYLDGVPHYYHAFIWDRSGLSAKFGIHRLAGVIDNDYRGEWKVCLHNTSDSPVYIEEGEKIAQFVIQLVPVVTFKEGVVNETNRGSSGFGSTN
jgi:deoxyuridine 5'-triphosphate nucleotidohydrolase